MSIPYVVDGETDLDSALFNPIIDAVNTSTTTAETVANSAINTFNVRDYEGVGDGVTNDTPAAVAAVAAGLATGKPFTLLFPDYGPWLLDPVSGFGPSSMKFCVYIDTNDVTVEGRGGATIKFRTGHANDAAIFSFNGMNVPDGPSGWLNHWIGDPSNVGTYPVYAIDPVAKGDATITLDDAGDAADFAVGDLIVLRTGAVNDGSDSEPDAEVNEIIDINGGVLSLRWAALVDYEQEYFISGTTGKTSTSVTANPALFGVQIVTPAWLRNVAVKNLNFDIQPDTGRCWGVFFSQAMNVELSGCTFTGVNGGATNGGQYRWASFRRNTIHLNLTSASDAWLGTNTCCADVEIADNNLSAEGTYPGLLHIHEGTKRSRIVRNRLTNPPNSSVNSAIQIFGRGYDIDVAENFIEHDSDGGGLAMQAGVGSDGIRVLNNIIQVNSISLDGTNSVVRGNSGAGRVFSSQPMNADVNVISKWVYHNSAASTILGAIPRGAYVLQADVYVFTAFNGTTPTLKVGNQGGYDQWFIETVDLSVQGRAGVQHLDTGYFQQSGAESRNAELVYSAGGSSAGAALVVMAWAWAEAGSGV